MGRMDQSLLERLRASAGPDARPAPLVPREEFLKTAKPNPDVVEGRPTPTARVIRERAQPHAPGEVLDATKVMSFPRQFSVRRQRTRKPIHVAKALRKGLADAPIDRDTRDELLLLIRRGAFPHVAAKAVGLSSDQFKRIMAAFPNFRRDVEMVHAQARAQVESTVGEMKPDLWLTKGPAREGVDPAAGTGGWAASATGAQVNVQLGGAVQQTYQLPPALDRLTRQELAEYIRLQKLVEGHPREDVVDAEYRAVESSPAEMPLPAQLVEPAGESRSPPSQRAQPSVDGLPSEPAVAAS